MRLLLTASFAFILSSAASADAKTVDTKLEKTTVRLKPSATASAVGVLPVGSKIEVIGQSGGFSKVRFKAGNAWQEGFISTSQLSAGSSDATKAIGTGSAKSTGYSKKDVAAATFMGVPAEAAEDLMAETSSARTTVASANEISDEFEGLPEGLTADVDDSAKAAGESAKDSGASIVNSATNTVAKKKTQLEQETNAKKIRGDAEAKLGDANTKVSAKKNEVTGAANAKRSELEAKKNGAIGSATKSVDAKKAEIDNQVGAQKSALDHQKNALQGEFENADVNKAAMGAAAGAAKTKNSMMAVGDMSGVEELESILFSKTDFSQDSPFVSEGHLKSKTLK